jgi:RimJ/RimL family protein N-acetyltransferase
MDKYLMKDGRQFIIRQPKEGDAEGIINYSKILFASTDQVLTTLEEYTITVDNEKIWIQNLNDNPNALLLIAQHVSVHPNFQGMGIGRRLIETLLAWANENKQIEKIFLTVFDTNNNALKLYKDLGFIEEGRHIKAIKQLNGEYVDTVQMYLETN